MLEAILSDREGRSVATIAQSLGLPGATAHRQVTTLVHEQYLMRLPGRRLGPGRRLLALLDLVDAKQVIVAAAAPVLHRLAAKVRCAVQLGTLDNDMVTYRIKMGQGAGDLFTRVGMQLEAYCTAIGKVLLAHLPEGEREVYLRTEAFPALTTHTITSPADLREELRCVAAQGFARDNEEIAVGLVCIAVPIHGPNGCVSAAISVSRASDKINDVDDRKILEQLLEAAAQIQSAITPTMIAG